MPFTGTFDGPNRLVILSSGTTSVDVREMYSAWKAWVMTGSNSKYLPFFTAVGGDTIDSAAGTLIPTYLYLLDGAKVRPQEANHTLSIAGGVLLTDDSGDPITDTLGNYRVRIRYQQPVQGFGYSTTGGSGVSASDVADAVWGHAQATDLATKIGIAEAILRNKTVTDPTTGIMTVYDTDGVTPLFSAQMYEGVTTAQTYRGSGAERRERLA